jgi:hypothetical protein
MSGAQPLRLQVPADPFEWVQGCSKLRGGVLVREGWHGEHHRGEQSVCLRP